MPGKFLFRYKLLDSRFGFKTPIIGLGAQSKSSLALGAGREVFISEPCLDLSNAQEFEKFENILKGFIRFSGAKTFAYDLHPAYNYRQLIGDFKAQGSARFFGIQHHQAHIASCIFEHNIKHQVIGVAFDGTGFGTDANLWGGEFFISGLKCFKRVAHLAYLPLAGGEEAILEPWRIAASALYEIYGKKFPGIKIDFLKALDKKKWFFLEAMLAKNINCPLSSSAGRLFDAVSALLGLVKDRILFEAEGPIKLERLAGSFKNRNSKKLYYNYKIGEEEVCRVIGTSDIIRGIVSDLEGGVKKEEIAFKFHKTLAKIILDVAVIIRKSSRINSVVLSGGVFTNKLLSSLTRQYLAEKGFEVFEHSLLKPGDESVCVGQIMIANSKKAS